MSEVADVLISIHPIYAEAILAGEKTVELRRRIPELPVGARLWIYATRPTAAVIGFVTIGQIWRAHPSAIWRKHRDGTGIDHATFSAYFDGAEIGVAILLEAAERIVPVTISHMRKIRGTFHPPQVMIRLSEIESAALRKLVRSPQESDLRSIGDV